MKVLILGSGRSYHATRWANALAESGLGVSFVTIHRRERPLRDDVDLVELPSIGRASFLLNTMRVRSLVRRIRPDIVHSHSAGGYAIMGRLSGFRPWITSVYGSDVFEAPTRSRFHKAYIGHLLRSSDRVLVTSGALAEHVTRIYPFVPRPSVTPFGVELDLFAPDSRSDARVQEDVIKIGVVKKLEPIYGIDVLLEAYRQLEHVERRTELHIVGDGSQRDELVSMAEATGRLDTIFFHGPIPNAEVPDFLRTLDIFVVPSRSESFGVAAVEACAMGLPVIVSNVGGLPEVVEHDVTGLVVEKENPAELARALRHLIDSPSHRARLGSGGRKKVESEFDWKANVTSMLHIYREVRKGSE